MKWIFIDTHNFSNKDEKKKKNPILSTLNCVTIKFFSLSCKGRFIYRIQKFCPIYNIHKSSSIRLEMIYVMLINVLRRPNVSTLQIKCQIKFITKLYNNIKHIFKQCFSALVCEIIIYLFIYSFAILGLQFFFF